MLSRTVGQRGGIERQNLRLAACVFLAPVEALAGFLACHAALEHADDERRDRPDIAAGIVAQPNAKISYHVTQHVEARDIHRPEGCAFGTSERRLGDGVDFSIASPAATFASVRMNA